MRGILGRKFINLWFSNLKRPMNPIMSLTTLCPLQEPDQEEVLDLISTMDMDDAGHYNSDSVVVGLSSTGHERLFFSDPGRSSSIMECCSEPVLEELDRPYMDFRRSMEEMVEAGNLSDVRCKSNWDYLHELLLCYLVLNPKTAHKFIDRAFSDLIFTLTAHHHHAGAGRPILVPPPPLSDWMS